MIKKFEQYNLEINSETEFRRFKKTIKEEPSDDGWYKIIYTDSGNEVGAIEGSKFKEFTTVQHININKNYQGKGYSKFMYKDALDFAHSRGDNLMVGGQLQQENKTRTTYKNFNYYEYPLKNQHGKPYIIITSWRGKNNEVLND